jgi:4'-phosphopantetheinyl transferase
VHWLARSARSLPGDLSWLAPAERARASQLRTAKRRQEYLLRRFTAKQAVAALARLPVDTAALARIAVPNAPSGAPYVLIDGAPAGWHISLTDRAGCAVCVVHTAGVGCDLELVEPRSDGFVEDFLTFPERAYVAGQPDLPARHEAANLVWSAKESALKVLRTGLRRDTRTVEVSVQAGGPGAWAPLTIRTGGPTLHGWWRRDGPYLLTVAALEAGSPPVALEPGGIGPSA